jgi:phosphohistidine phosphatase SixA
MQKASFMKKLSQGRYWVIVVVLLLLVTGCSSTPPRQTQQTPTQSLAPPTPTVTTPSPTVAASFSATWSLLQQGDTGYVVMMRHALAPGTGDPPNFRLEDCSTQRNLSAQGRAQARQIGEAFRRRGIKVSRVLSSQWCRCLETARLLNLGPVKPFTPLNSFFRDRSAIARQTTEVREFITANRNTVGTIILVTHQVNITALTDIVPQSGESVVLRANEQDQVEVIGRIESFRRDE